MLTRISSVLFIALLAISSFAKAEYLVVHATEYGDEWPYKVDRIELFCYEKFERYVLFDTAAGERYALNGDAQSHFKGRYPAAYAISKPYPLPPGIEDPNFRMSAPSGLIQRGLDLCD